MIAIPPIIGVLLLICLYFIGRRWIVARIYASLVSAELASPQRSKWVDDLLAKRKELEKQGLEGSKEYEQVEDRIAAINPMCAYGRQKDCLLETAWELYDECGWKRRRIPPIER
jgi:hypothetical protein